MALRRWTGSRPRLVGPSAGVIELFRREGTVRDPCGVNDVVAALGAGTPTLLVMTISDAFYSPGRDGIVAGAEPPDPSRVHAVLAVGHGSLAYDAGAFLVRNSWGPNWGEAGHAWLHEDYLAPRLLRSAIMAGEVA